MANIEEILIMQDQKLKENFKQKISGYYTKGMYYEKNFALEAHDTQYLPNKVLVMVKNPDGSYYKEGFNGEYAWEMYERVYDKKYEALYHNGEFPSPIKSLLDVTKRGHKVEFVKEVEIDGKKYFELLITLNDGFQRLFYIDTVSYYISKAKDYRQLHPVEGESFKTIEVSFENIIEHDGVKIPTKKIERDADTNEILTTVEWKEIIINPNIEENIFEKLELIG